MSDPRSNSPEDLAEGTKVPHQSVEDLEEARPFADGESVEAAAERQGEGGGPKSMERDQNPDYDPSQGPKGETQ
jgi:hypothetical protein